MVRVECIDDGELGYIWLEYVILELRADTGESGRESTRMKKKNFFNNLFPSSPSLGRTQNGFDLDYN